MSFVIITALYDKRDKLTVAVDSSHICHFPVYQNTLLQTSIYICTAVCVFMLLGLGFIPCMGFQKINNDTDRLKIKYLTGTFLFFRLYDTVVVKSSWIDELKDKGVLGTQTADIY